MADDYTSGKPWKVARRQHIMQTAFQLFCERGIGRVTMPEIAEASNIGRATLYRYFATKLDLVVAIGAQQWDEYISWHDALLPPEELDRMTGAQYLRFYLEAFVDLYRNHADILRFNYSFNSYLSREDVTPEQWQPYMDTVQRLGEEFHAIYERGMHDGTLNPEIPEASMFSSSFHIMLAAATRYATGLVYVSEDARPEDELVMLVELLLSRYTREPGQTDSAAAINASAG